MDPSLIWYNLVLGVGVGLLPPVGLAASLARGAVGRAARGLGDLWPRLGLYRGLAPAGRRRGVPRVWLQAVSVGEVMVARAIAEELWRLLPGVQLTVTASTAAGLARARQDLGLRAAVAPFPLEAPWAVAAAAGRIRPHLYASLETELWPNLTAWLHRRGVTCLLLNGRISPRSFPRYRRVRPLVRGVLSRLEVLSMIGPADARRVVALGADPARVRVDGNAKYAGLVERARPQYTRQAAARLALGGAPLVVAGSVRRGEEEPVVEGFVRLRRRHPSAVLALVPRHPERAGGWLAVCSRAGLAAQLWSRLSPQAPRRAGTAVVVVDAMGVLMPLYGLARVAFLGASLVPLGGQNPMEPAAWGVPVCWGRSMEDFADAAAQLLEAGAGEQVSGAGELARFWGRMLADSDEARRRGRAARAVVRGHSGAARAAAELIAAALERKGVIG